MKPLQWAVLGAVLGVAVTLYLLNLDAGNDRQQNRRAAEERTEDGRRTGGNAAEDSDARDGGGGERPGAGLTATLKIVRPDGSPAARAEVTLSGHGSRTETAGSDGAIELADLLEVAARSAQDVHDDHAGEQHRREQ